MEGSRDGNGGELGGWGLSEGGEGRIGGSRREKNRVEEPRIGNRVVKVAVASWRFRGGFEYSEVPVGFR